MVEVVVPAAEAGVEDVVEESLITSSTKFRRHVPYGEWKFALCFYIISLLLVTGIRKQAAPQSALWV